MAPAHSTAGDSIEGNHRDFLLGLTREADPGYDQVWVGKWQALELITIETYLVHSDSWLHTPSLMRYREVPKEKRALVAEEFARKLGSALNDLQRSVVICVERPYLEGFIHGIEQTLAVPFVLLVVNGGDAPLTQPLQDQIVKLPGLQACFANNLHKPVAGDVFHPMPLGVTGEASLNRVRLAARPWFERDRRLLVAPMRMNNRLRKRYFDVLSGEEYSSMVRIVTGHVPHGAFLELLAEHQCTLSPPGRGYDCGRTWQALAVGTLPLVVDDDAFDQRLHVGAGPEFVPLPDDLTPEKLAALLARLSDPSQYLEKMQVRHWRERWSFRLENKAAPQMTR